MADMGLDFKPPRQNDAKAWTILQGMFRVGHEFQTCGCNGPGWIPASTSDYRIYLANRKKIYQERLDYVQKSTNIDVEEKQQALEHWADRLASIDQELRSVE